MLVQLSIRDLAIVERLDLEFGPGATVLTGETGAGKSILVDALGLAAGGRASSALVRPGCERADVTAVFEVGGLPAVLKILKDLETDDPEAQCVLRRIVGADGRSRAFVNGTPVSAGTLRMLGDRLVDIHGQHSHHALLRRNEQRRLLDAYANHDQLLENVESLHAQLVEFQRQIEAEQADGEDPSSRLDYLRFQVKELDSLNLSAGALAAINEEHARLAHAGELQQASQDALAALDDEDAACARAALAVAVRAVARIEGLDSSMAGARQLLEQATIEIDEASAQIRRYRERLDADPERLEAVERRLSSIHDFARKHRVDPVDLPALAERLRAEVDSLEGRGDRLVALEKHRDEVLKRFREAAGRLSESRRKAAAALSRAVTENLARLGMTGARFDIQLESDPTRESAAFGVDRIEFRVAANPGLPMQPVASTASGGELSRISLAIQVIDVSATGIPSVILDEVDVGIGGRHADVVGRMLRTMSQNRQILCVTHQPQVASCATHHLRILKNASAGSTTTSAEYLHGEQRVEEIARMLGGAEVTRQTVAHAREMIQRA
jgi:DNA repair protein RecN (Recombination protein N)